MSDYAHRKTDALLSEMESKVFGIYQEAYIDLGQKLRLFLETFDDEDEARRILVENGKMTWRDYIGWREEEIMRKNQLKSLINTMAKDMVNYDKIAMSVVGEQLPEVYALNANYTAYSISKDTKLNLSWTLYDRDTVENLIRGDKDILPIPAIDVIKDEQWNRQKINNAVTQGILQGEPIPDIARRLVSVTNMGYNAAVRNARTATTCAQNAGRIDSYKRAQAMGIDLQQEWLATLDKRTRHEHRLLDGQRVNVGEKFKVNGDEIAFPGDPEAPGYLIYNCRCTLVAAIKGHDQSKAPRDSKLKGMTYEEWKYELTNKQEKMIDNGSDNVRKNMGKAAPSYNYTEAVNLLKNEIGFKNVDSSISYMDESVLTEIANNMVMLENRFNVIHKSKNTKISIENSKKDEAWVSSVLTNPVDQQLFFEKQFFSSKKECIRSMLYQLRNNHIMPFAFENAAIYDSTHEYGHMLENTFFVQAYIDKGWNINNPYQFIDTTKNAKKEIYKWYYDTCEETERKIRNEIIDIAVSNNPNFNLSDNLSEYGKTNSGEFFAEAFANYWCGDQNELGKAMGIWLNRKGF